MNLKNLRTVGLCIAVLATSCAPRVSRTEETVVVKSPSSPDTKAFHEVDAAYRAHNFENVLKKSKAFLHSFPKSEHLDQVYSLRGLSNAAQKQFDFALFNFKKGLETATELLGPNHERVAMLHYNVAFAHFELNQLDPALQSLQKVKTDLIAIENRPKFFVLKAKVSKARQDYFTAAASCLEGLAVTPVEDTATRGGLSSLFSQSVDLIHDIEMLDKLLDGKVDLPILDQLHYKIGVLHFQKGERNRSRPYFEAIVSKFAGGRYYSAADDYLRRLNSQDNVKTQRVGVLLTLSGKFARFGYNALQGIELATRIFQATAEGPESPVTLVVVDDQGEPERALAAMEELYFKHQVIAVVGPLISKLAEPVGKKAQELGLPLIALTQKEAIGGDYVFNAALTPAMQVRQLMQYAREKAGARKFAMMSPSTKFGEEYSKAFWEEIDATSGADQCTVRGFETYNSDETDFRIYVDRLAGLSHQDARAREQAELETLKAASPVKTKSTKKLNQMFSLKPIVDFDAVFIPDEPKVLGQLLPTFAYRDVEGALFLGINTWNSPELVARAGTYVEGAVFVDGFYAESANPATKRFLEEYRKVFGSEPTLVEAVAYDAAKVIYAILSQGRASSRGDLRDQITALKNFPGVSGRISFEAGRLTKRLNLLTVKSGKIVEIAF